MALSGAPWATLTAPARIMLPLPSLAGQSAPPSGLDGLRFNSLSAFARCSSWRRSLDSGIADSGGLLSVDGLPTGERPRHGFAQHGLGDRFPDKGDIRRAKTIEAAQRLAIGPHEVAEPTAISAVRFDTRHPERIVRPCRAKRRRSRCDSRAHRRLMTSVAGACKHFHFQMTSSVVPALSPNISAPTTKARCAVNIT